MNGTEQLLFDVAPSFKTPPHPPGESDEFYTLWEDFNPWNKHFRFSVDACALNADCAKVKRFYSPEQDGLKQNYAHESVWCNPPYSDIEPWVVKADHEMRNGCRDWVMLLPQNRQEQPWWQTHIEPIRDLPRNFERNRDGVGVLFSLVPDRRFLLSTSNLSGRRRFGYPGSEKSPGNTTPQTGHVLVIWRAV